MPTLIIQEPGRRTGGVLNGRVLIGRLPTNGVALADSSVSRLHAWIGADRDGRYFVGDSGSLTGTWVNGRTIEKRKMLADGDVVRIGSAQITFSMDEELPEDVTWVDLGGQPPSDNVAEAGVLFDCPCGAPVWFKAGGIGQAHQCRHCGRTFRVPGRSGVIAEEVAPPPFLEPGIPHGTGESSDEAGMPAAEPRAAQELYGEDSVLGVTDETMRHADEHGLTENEVTAGDVGVEDPADAPEAEAAAEPAPPELASDELAPADAYDIEVSTASEPFEEDAHSIQELAEDSPAEQAPAAQDLSDQGPDDFGPESEAQPAVEAGELAIMEEAATPEQEAAAAEEGGAVPDQAASSEGEIGPVEAEVDAEAQAVEPIGLAEDAAAAELADAPPEWLAPPQVAAQAAPAPEQTCSVCRSVIGPEEQSVACPSCGLTFHAECWRENLGCSAYGCDQAGVLKQDVDRPPLEPVESFVAESGEIAMPSTRVTTVEALAATERQAGLDRPPVWKPPVSTDKDDAPYPWEFAFLGAAVMGALGSVMTYGLPALIGAIGTLVYLIGFRDGKRGALVGTLALLVCLLGFAGGVYASYLYWSGWPPIGPFARAAGRVGGAR